LKLIVGIGNPGRQYLNTRHNIGFQILDSFCKKHGLAFGPSKSDYWLVESSFSTFHFFLVKPTTYVNNTGIVVKELIGKYNLNLNDILIITDDSNLEPGVIRIRKSGSDGGHNGIKSIIYHLENDEFARLRIGIGQPEVQTDLADYVLSEFSKGDIKILEKNIPHINEMLENFISGGLDEMLNHFSKFMKRNSTDTEQ
jgi:PTH1 family peptidyl-tRNA hydrolase